MAKFRKGQSGNPNGRPPKVVEGAHQSVLAELFDEQAERDIVAAQIRKARAGNTIAATWLWDRKYGKVKEHVEQSGETITTIKVVHVRKQPRDTD